MIVEFLGNSGAGKTTLIPILIQLLRDNGLVAMSVTEAIHHYMRKTVLGRALCRLTPMALQGPILWRVFSYGISKLYIAQFTIRHPQLARYVLSSQLGRQIPWRHRWLILRLFFQMTGEFFFLKSRSRPNEIIIFDEGFVHRVVQTFVSESERPDPDQVVEYLKLLPQSDSVILVKTPLDVCLARVRVRGLQVRLRGLSAQDVAQFMANAERAVNVASQYLRDTGRTIIEIANNDDLDKCAAELRHDVAPYLSRRANAA